ncbi:hypothetical protein OUZ56_019643 [Daphnia magna]|uniref:Uncharacterized protein n=1 Tax=Daphnia magna TaxID=35525 RepID=A0ABQ9ZC63_9CRUS|nr:hypothetical protein OUZ56_019643 [Daphnia magna]
MGEKETLWFFLEWNWVAGNCWLPPFSFSWPSKTESLTITYWKKKEKIKLHTLTAITYTIDVKLDKLEQVNEYPVSIGVELCDVTSSLQSHAMPRHFVKRFYSAQVRQCQHEFDVLTKDSSIV